MSNMSVVIYVLHAFLWAKGVLVSMYVQLHEIMKHVKGNMQLHDSYARVLRHVTVEHTASIFRQNI
jgi:hypothetical protein